MTTTLREYWLILVFVLALIAMLGVSYGSLLKRSLQATVAQMQMQR